MKKHFPKMMITIIGDGLYACEKVLSTCLKNNWQHLITSKEGRMPAVTEKALLLMQHNPDQRKAVQWGGHQQQYCWANDKGNGYGQPDKDCSARYMWLNSQAITKANLFFRCSKLARGRWAIGNNLMTKKHRAYLMEQAFPLKNL